MRIRKVYQGNLADNKIVNAASNSQTNTYSCDYINNLIDAIGTIYSENFDNSTVTDNTLTTAGTITLPKGTYLITGFGSFASNSTGYRQMGIATSSSSSSIDRSATSTASAVNGSATAMQVITMINPNAQTTYYLNVRQNSGSSLSFTYGGFRAIKLK